MYENKIKLDVNAVENCPICESLCVEHLVSSTWVKSDRQLLDMLGMKYIPASWAHCKECNHVFLNPSFSSEIEGRLYGSESLYRKYSRAGKTDEEYMLEIDPTINNKGTVHSGHLHRIQKIKKYLVQNKNIVCLDFGAGFGSAQSAVTAMGWTYYGLEKDAWCLEKAQDLGRQISDLIPEDIKQKGADLIYSAQVFEHIKTPAEVKSLIRSSLKEGGVLYINVPTHKYSIIDINTVDMGGLNCLNWGHFQSYSPESMSRLLLSWGFVVCDVWISNGDLNIIAKKCNDDIKLNFASAQKFSTSAEKIKIKLLYIVFWPMKLIFFEIPINMPVRKIIGVLPRGFKDFLKKLKI